MMFGGLKKSASRLALVAAAGVLSTNAYAADLGGDCCADLEERVAELEATTARKGTRKTSLEIWGQVNKMILSYNDGTSKNTDLGIDNTNSSTRFGFRGKAKVSPSVTAGYAIMVEVASGARSVSVRDDRMQAPVNAASSGGYLNVGVGDHTVQMRDVNFWIESVSLGRATVGRLTGSGPTGTIDLGGIGMAASGSQSLIGGSMRFRRSDTGGLTSGAFGASGAGTTLSPLIAASGAYTITNTTDNNGDYSSRVDGVQWTSPVFAGFQATASIGEALQKDITIANSIGNVGDNTGATKLGPTYAARLQYANEFSGVRVAANAAYEVLQSNGSAAAVPALVDRPNSTNMGFALALMHVATGLFAQGEYMRYVRGHDDGTSDAARQWQVQAGISKNWFGVGNTAFYGEYAKTDNGYNTFTANASGGATYPLALVTTGTAATVGLIASGQPAGVSTTDNTHLKQWGLGITQNIDAAAMQLYAGYRSFSLSSERCTTTFGGCKDIQLLYTGARIQF